MKKTAIATAALLFISTSAFAADCAPGQVKITPEQVAAAQKAWGEGIVAIGSATDPRQAAIEHIDKFYAYDIGAVLFKPTLAVELPFRDSKEEALSYFVGGQEKEDSGFALRPFTSVRFENHATAIDCDSALAQGHYYFTPREGDEIKVEYTLGYVRDKDGNLKINLQHSSVPYKAQ